MQFSHQFPIYFYGREKLILRILAHNESAETAEREEEKAPKNKSRVLFT